jgi:DNA polymerase III epsilon subunit-like protein
MKTSSTHQEETFTMMNTPDIRQHYEAITALLSTEEAAPPVSRLADWEAQQVRRAVLTEHIQQLELAVAQVQRRLTTLPTLARPEHLHWAQALLAFPNLAFLEVDTDGLYADADILRIVLVDQSSAVLYDQVVQPRRPLSSKIAYLTGITPGMVASAPTLAEVRCSSRLVAALVGCYILSFNLEFDQGKLSESAERYGLPLLPLVGDCLMLRAQEYYGASHYPKLADLCERLGAPLPPHPEQNALDRARGQVHLLRMMAHGIMHVSAPPHAKPVAERTDSDSPGDPFLPDVPDEAE